LHFPIWRKDKTIEKKSRRGLIMKAATYLYFKDNSKEAIELYKSIFNAEVVCEYLFEDGMTQDQELLGKMFHAEIKIGDQNLYFSDTGKEALFDSMKFVVEYREEDEAKRCLEKIVLNGKLISDFKKMPVGPTIAHAIDKFGIHWNIVIC
jgi:PhnB protein